MKALQESADKNKGFYKFDRPDPEVLDLFDRPAYVSEVALEVKNHTSLCPITGQPDYAKIKIRYVPRKKCLETKSCKLYLMGYRNHGAFAEQTASLICKDLVSILEPEEVEVHVTFDSRGDIGIIGKASYSAPKASTGLR